MTVQEHARIIDKPWGHEEIFAETDSYVGKILAIREGEALSLQYHEVKEETLRVLDGRLEVALGPRKDRMTTHVLKEGAIFHVAPGTLHRMVAITDCRLLEVSTNHLDDVVRLEDRYGREGTNAP
ncbi:MAG: cupin domain-containing protein [Thermoanaerobaculales bacterium]|jgi:mannose-6-phosphate isomerase-like protein (cupin superfamily)|nr:cupin domain-containing protein [Thermoanaerobaculales bacterium]